MRSFRSVGSLRASGEIVLLSRSLSIEIDHAVLASARCVTESFAPIVVESYAGVTVYQCCASAFREKCGRKTYGCVKSTRTPRSSDDQRACRPAVRAPPRKLR